MIHSIARKSGLTDAEAQDVVQDTIICVARGINKFKRDQTCGSFKGWLRNLTRWRIADQCSKRQRGALWTALVPHDDTLRKIFVANHNPADWGGLVLTPWFLSLGKT